jgi:tRNA (guanine37-N1)-methyltransferase
MLHFHILTLFPDSIESYLQSSILGKAREKKLIKISYYDPKEYTKDKYGRVDRRPYGGGPGMVLEPDGMLRAGDAALKKAASGKQKAKKPEVIFFATDGEQFSEEMAKKMAKHGSASTKHILLICGRYEGVDARVPKILKAKPITVGPYVLTGGELPAATLIDAIARFVPGVLGKAESLEASRVSSPEVYTRPEVLVWKGKKYKVPPVLLTGDHAKIEQWKQLKRKGIVQ